jgi:L-alanine-DL-glutamate epimerase-like enolase superfamily enzyme
MQITRAEVIPVELSLRRPVHMAGLPEIRHIQAIFVRIETRQGQTAWGCTVAHLDLTGEQPADVLRKCREYACIVPDLHPTNLEYSLTELENLAGSGSPGALCAFDLAFHDLLCLAAGMPLYRLLGGYRNRIQTSATVPVSPLDESVDTACRLASLGFQILKIKGGLDPEQDVRRVQAIHRALPQHRLRLDADGGYTLQGALDVARALKDQLEMLEQPTPASDLPALRQVTQLSPLPILADQSLSGPASALEIAVGHAASGLSLKLASCGGLRCARQIDAIARVARLATMVSCFVEPSLLIAAGLSFALSSPNVQYGDLDGNLDLLDDPSRPCFRLEEGWLVATDVPGLGYTVDLDA